MGGVEPGTVRTSLEIPASLYRKLHAAAERRGCSVRQLILDSIERIVAEELALAPRRAVLPMVAADGRVIRPVTRRSFPDVNGWLAPAVRTDGSHHGAALARWKSR